MKKILLFAAAALSFAGCAEDAPTPGPAGDAGKFAEMSVPSSFGWKTTASVACNFTAPQPTRVYVAAGQEAEPFASFMVGGDADPVKLDVPAATRTLYVSCRTESGVSPQVAVPVTSDGAFCSLDPKAASGTRAGIGNDDEASVDEGLIYIPARRNGWGTLMFEDLWPAYGDFDFNDFVVNYKIQLYMQNKNKVNAMLIGVRVKAVGGSIPYDLCLAMKGVKGGEIDEIEPYNSKNAPEAELEASCKELDEKVTWLLHNSRKMDNYLELEPFSKDGRLCAHVCDTLKSLPETPTLAAYKDYKAIIILLGMSTTHYAILDELAEQHRKRDEIPELTAYCDALHWMRPGRQYLCNVYNTVCHAFHLLRRNPVRGNRLLVTEKELRHAERMLPELGRQTFTEMVRLKGYMVYDAEKLADKCGMEYGSFRRKVKKMTGYTAKEWVIKERVKDVEHYLLNTNLTLTEVAFTTGFASTSNLNDFCKAYLLDTPGEIRRKAQETRKCTVTRT